MATTTAYTLSRERIEHICAGFVGALDLRLALVAELDRVVGVDAYAWLLTDPETSVGCAPLADCPCLPELPTLIRHKYLTTTNRWTRLRDRPVELLTEATGGELTRSLLWREMLHRYDVRDIASLVFADRFGCWGFLDLWKVGDGRPFTVADVDFLCDIAPIVTGALRRVQARTFLEAPDRDPRGGEPVVLLLSGSLQVVAQTPETEQFLRVLVPPPSGAAPIPASAYNVAAQLLAREAGVDDNPASARVHLTGGTWLTLRAARIGSGADSHRAGGGDIAVTIQESSSLERLAVFVRAFGFSQREREVMDRLAAGADTRQVAQSLNMSEHTVQDHLKTMFTKTGTRNRRTLLSHALGH